jgi:hypothetical protein
VTRRSRIRLSGVIVQLARGAAITTHGGETWVIEPSDGLELPVSGKVVLEGVPSGLDRLMVDWVGQHPDT